MTPRPTPDTRHSRSIHPLAVDCVVLKDKLGRAGLFKTMQKMEDVVTAVGWEIAEHKQQRKAARK